MEKDIDTPEILLLPPPAVSLTQRMPTIPQLAVALGGLALIFGLSYLPFVTQSAVKEAEHTVTPVPPEGEETVNAGAFADTRISARAAYVWDVKNQKALYNKNAGTQLPLASLTKLMTALVAYEHLPESARIAITTQAVNEEGDSSLMPGETFTLKKLADLTLMTSSNDGASALAAAAGAALTSAPDGTASFIAAMNATAEQIGLSQSYFTNPTGLDVDGTHSGSYGSARDMAFLMEYLILKHPDILAATKDAHRTIYDEEGAAFRTVNTNEITHDIPGLIGSKTGFTGLAGGNLVIAYDAGLNRPIIIAVLGSTRDGRFSDVTTLLHATAQVIATQP